MRKLLLLFLSTMFILSCSIDRMDKVIAIEGLDGSTTLVGITQEQPGENCESGGTRLDFGTDINSDGSLTENEITQTAFVCNGLDGQDGQDGLSSLINVVAIEATEEQCINGGVVVQTGLDLNGNGILDTNEILSATFVCAGVNGQDGVDGIDGIDGINSTVTTEQVQPSEEHPYGGYYLYITTGDSVEVVFISNGITGEQGIQGIQGIPGIDGVDGISSTITAIEVQPSEEYPNGGYFLQITSGDSVEVIFISNGADGTNGLDGIDGINGQDGASVTVTVQESEGGYWLIINQDGNITQVFISNGVDGIDGINGTDGASVIVTSEEVDGGHLLTFLQNGNIITQIFVRDGVDGIDGIDGINGVSVTVTSEETEGGNILYFYQNDVLVTQVFVYNGIDGLNGLDGIDGTNGLDGVSVTVTSEETEGGNILYFYQGDVLITQIFVQNGLDGENGLNGLDGIDGIDGTDGVSVTVTTQEVDGGYTITFFQDGVEVSTIFVSSGIDGIDGVNGTSTTITTEVTDGGYWVIFLESGIEINRIFVSNGLDGIDGMNGTSTTITTESADGGYWLIFLENGTEINRIFVSYGADGLDGIDGIDGIDGVSSTITTEQVEGGYILYITVDNETTSIFISNGADGLDGLNGIDGIDGTDGISSTIQTEVTENGYFLHITVDGITTTIFISDGENGQNGLSSLFNVIPNSPDANSTTIEFGIDDNGNGILESNEVDESIVVSNGTDGTDGENGQDGVTSYINIEVSTECEYGGIVVTTWLDLDGDHQFSETDEIVEIQQICNDAPAAETVTLCHKVTHPVAEHPEWGSNTRVTLTLTFSEFVQHTLEFHNGNSTQNDSFGSCE